MNVPTLNGIFYNSKDKIHIVPFTPNPFNTKFVPSICGRFTF